MAKALGVGGIFFKCRDEKTLVEWYAQHLGIAINEYGGIHFEFADAPPQARTVFGAFSADTDYFDPSKKDFMINLMVDDLEEALAQVKTGGAEIIDGIDKYDFGSFGWFIDPEGNKIELWQLPNS